MKPPYDLTQVILTKTASISEKLGEIKSAYLQKAPAELRKRNRIRTIQSSLEIEGNTLNLEQITAILDNKRVAAPQKDIIEVQNAIEAYNYLNTFNPCSIESLCSAHKIMMKGLVPDAGYIRSTAVGIIKDMQVTHMAPPGHFVKALLNDLFDYLENDDELLLIKSCVFHYEFEFIHPFIDGNGRLGRLWQTLILKQYNSIFEFLPIETIIKKRQSEYYTILGKSDNLGNSTPFIEFMLSIIEESLEELLQSQNITLSNIDRIKLFETFIGSQPFSRADYLRNFKDISTATASRDLKKATENGYLVKSGDGRMTSYRFKH